MNTLDDKLNLIVGLDRIMESIKDMPKFYVLQQICENYKKDYKSNSKSQTSTVEELLGMLKNYNALDSVSKFIRECVNTLNANKYLYLAERMRNEYQNQMNPMYQSIGNKINEAIIKSTDEESLKMALQYDLYEYHYIPQIKNILNMASDFHTSAINESATYKSFMSKTHYSPVLRNGNDIVFALNGINYIGNLSSGKLDIAYNKVSHEFNALKESISYFKPTSNGFTYDSGKHNICIGFDGNVTVDGSPLKVMESVALSLVYSGALPMSAMHIAQYAGVLQSNIGLMESLSFVKNISNRMDESTELNVVKIGNRVYLNKYDVFGNSSTIVPFASTDELTNEASKIFPRDYVTATLNEFLDIDVDYTSILYENKDMLKSRIAFIKDKMEKIQLLENGNAILESKKSTIHNAMSILESEYRNNANELISIYSKLGYTLDESLTDMGITRATITSDYYQFKKGDIVTVNKNEYMDAFVESKIGVYDSNFMRFLVPKSLLQTTI